MPEIRPIRTQLGYQAPQAPAVGAGGAGGQWPAGDGGAVDTLERLYLGYRKAKQTRNALEAERDAGNTATKGIMRVTTPPEDHEQDDAAPAWVDEDAAEKYTTYVHKQLNEYAKRHAKSPERVTAMREHLLGQMDANVSLLRTMEEAQDNYHADQIMEQMGREDRDAIDLDLQMVRETGTDPATGRVAAEMVLERVAQIRQRAQGTGDEGLNEEVEDEITDILENLAASYIYGLERGGMEDDAEAFRKGLTTGEAVAFGDVSLQAPLKAMTPDERKDFAGEVEDRVENLKARRLEEVAAHREERDRERTDFYTSLELYAREGMPPGVLGDYVAAVTERGLISNEEGRLVMDGWNSRVARTQLRAGNRETLAARGWGSGEIEIALDVNNGDLDRSEEFLRGRTSPVFEREAEQQASVEELIYDRTLTSEREIEALSPTPERAAANRALARQLREQDSAFVNEPWMRSAIVATRDPSKFGMDSYKMSTATISAMVSHLTRGLYAYGQDLMEMERNGEIQPYQKAGLAMAYVTDGFTRINSFADTLNNQKSQDNWRKVFRTMFRHQPGVLRLVKTYRRQTDLDAVGFANWRTAFAAMGKTLDDLVDGSEGADRMRYEYDRAELKAARDALEQEIDRLEDVASPFGVTIPNPAPAQGNR